MSTSLNNGSVTFGDGTTLSSGNIPWGNLSGVPGLVYANLKYNGNEQAGRGVYAGQATGNCGSGDFPNCNCSAYNCTGGYLNLDAGSGWDMYYYYFNCNCNCQCNCNCDCNCNCNC